MESGYMARPLFSIVCRTEGHGLLLMRTRPGSTTLKGISQPRT